MFRFAKILLICIVGFVLAGSSAEAQSFTLDDNSVSLNPNAGGQKVSDSHISATNKTSGNLQLTLTPTTNSGGNWLSASASPNPIPKGGVSTITITVDPAKLRAQQTYTGKVTVTAVSGGVTTTAVINVTVTPNGIDIIATPNPANIGVTQGKTVQANVKLLNSTGTTASGVSANFQSNQTWLTVTNFDGTNITVSVTATSLSVGPNSGTITISSSGGSPFVPIPLVVNAFVSPPPGLVANPPSLSFQGSSGTTIGPQPLSVTSNDPNTKLTFTATPSVPWVKLSATSGQTPAALNVTVDASTLNAGQQGGTITLACTGAPSCTTVAVQVSATITQTRLTSNLTSLSFQAYQSRPNPQSQSVLVATTDSQSLGFTVSNVPPWLQVSPTSGTASGSPTAISVIPVTSALNPGTNTGSFVITPANNTQAIGVNISAVLSPFTIGVTPNPPPPVNINPGKTQTITFNITTADNASADIGIATSTNNNSGNWLTVPANVASAPGTARVTVDATSLSVGTYSGNVTFSCNNATCTPVQVPVNVTVSSAPTIGASPASISFQKGPNNSLPASQTVNLSASDRSAQNFSFSVSPAANWLRVTSSQNATPAVLTLAVTSLPAQNSSTTLTITPANGSPAVGIPVSITVSSNGPVIQGVATASAFGGFSTITSGTYIEIYGSNLSTTTRGWAGQDFSGVNAPKVLDGVTVDINGQKAFVNFISPGQVNVVVPANIGNGPAQITLSNSNGASPGFTMNAASVAPGFFAPGVFTVNGKQYLGAILPDGAFAFPEGAIAGVASRPARPGETLVMYGLGFGPVSPDIPVGTIVQQANTLRNSLQILFGQTPAALAYDGLSPNFVGLYQFNVVVPDVPDNDAAPVTFNLGGAAGSQTLFIAVRR